MAWLKPCWISRTAIFCGGGSLYDRPCTVQNQQIATRWTSLKRSSEQHISLSHLQRMESIHWDPFGNVSGHNEAEQRAESLLCNSFLGVFLSVRISAYLLFFLLQSRQGREQRRRRRRCRCQAMCCCECG